MHIPSLDHLLERLSRELERDERGPGVAGLLWGYASATSDWRTREHYRPGGYTRNLLFKDAMYELLLLCWSEGGQSPIHNHMDQNCWMAVLAGEIEEVQFARPASPAGGLVQRRSLRFFPGQVAYISDDIGLHLVRPTGGPGVSLHLYSRPFDVCKVYDPMTGEESIKLLTYDSVEGEPFEEPVPSSSIPAR